ncbi:PTS system galactitol-specific transporter subunit IIB [Staphylococcus gallinarum]|uniref:PTS system galactitol-specific transporter subunit IIB n=1 Tax=Staphylococcus gallinarum TaxID=1293 RepID=A0A380F964_STAGA|nr:PTS system galactitol-specific transporter subunit IIB [Staphylococcus gallinarum]
MRKWQRNTTLKVDLKQIKISEVGAYVDTADLLVTTAMTSKRIRFPSYQCKKTFLTGIGVEDTKQEILAALKS